MTRTFCIPGIIFIFCAFVLSVLVSISLPYLDDFDLVRTHFSTSASAGANTAQAVTELRLGIWAYCSDDTSGDRTCAHTGHGYNVAVHDSSNNSGIIIGASWTRGLAVHPVAAAVTFLALLLSFSTHITVTLISSLTAFLAATLTLIAFAIDIALLAYTKHQMKKLNNVGESTYAAPGFWMTFASLLLLLLGGCTVCFGRRRARMSGATNAYPTNYGKGGFWRRFRRN